MYDPDSGLLYFAATGELFDPDTGKFVDPASTDTTDRSDRRDDELSPTDDKADESPAAPDSTDPSMPDKTLTPSDWNDTCAGGAVCDPDLGGLPTFNPGGGLDFGTP